MQQAPTNQKPQPAIGFSLGYGLNDIHRAAWEQSHERILALFPWLQSREIRIGTTSLRLWGHYDPQLATYHTADGDLLVIVGSTLNGLTWAEGAPQLKALGASGDIQPWEGRCIAIRISADGERWSIWSDWVGGVPVYHTAWIGGGVASSLEPVTVETADLGPEQISRRGLVELLLFGQFLGCDTLYEPMRYITPDSHTDWVRGRPAGEKRLWTVVPNEKLHGRTPDQLIEEWRALHIDAIAGPLRNSDEPVALTLSSGMDSRMIAAIMVEEARRTGRELRAYTYGPLESLDVALARQVAETLDIPWERVPIGQRYMADHMARWLEWFGTSLHAHGMYQFAFLSQVAGKRYLLPTGNLGNSIGGGGHPPEELLNEKLSLFERYQDAFVTYWPLEELGEVLTFDPKPYLAEMNDVLQEQHDAVRHWPLYPRMLMFNIWNRIGRAIFYQPMMYSYYGLERQPFTYRPMANFAFSLEPSLHRRRTLQLEMLRRSWPQVAAVPAPPYHKPMRGLQLKWHALRYHAQRRMPPMLRPLLGPTRLTMKDVDCVRTYKWASFAPLSPNLGSVEPLRAEAVVRAAEAAFVGEHAELRRVLAALPLVARFSNRQQPAPVLEVRD